MNINNTITTRSIALLVTALLAIGLVTGAAAVLETADEQTVEITDNETQEIVVDVEFINATNATVELTENETGTLVEEVELSGDADSWESHEFNVSQNIEYDVTTSAENANDLGEIEVEVVSTGGFFANQSDEVQLIGLALLLVFGVGLVFFRDEADPRGWF